MIQLPSPELDTLCHQAPVYKLGTDYAPLFYRWNKGYVHCGTAETKFSDLNAKSLHQSYKNFIRSYIVLVYLNNPPCLPSTINVRVVIHRVSLDSKIMKQDERSRTPFARVGEVLLIQNKGSYIQNSHLCIYITTLSMKCILSITPSKVTHFNLHSREL